ncbi:MAG: hypothetical protein GWN56_14610, partial [Nitrosopumilaceae archaeon]|nr:hypothetical protein [Nitrosopumilaceae archaeon]
SDSFFLIEQQIVVFRNQDLVKDTRLTDVSIDEENGLIDFSINIALSPEAFAFREQVDSLLEVETPTQ